MQYNQPFGVSDPNAAYINGNPSTGTMGSIPPAASIEYPQREIANLITDAGMVPTNVDLHQLAKAVQSGKLIYADDTGAVNQIALNVAPALTALHKGMIFITKAAFTNTGPTTATISGITARVVHTYDSSDLLAFDVVAGTMLALAFDGANFQLAWSAHVKQATGVLQANYNFYVNGSTGDDALYDGTSATITTAGHGPFKTIAKAITSASLLNANGFVITIHVADGIYGYCGVGNITNGGLVIKGNSANPSACIIDMTSSPGAACIQAVGTGVMFTADGFRVVAGNASGGFGILPQEGGEIRFQNIDFGPCTSAHIFADSGFAACTGDYKITGNAQYHMTCNFGEIIQTPSYPNTVSIGSTVGVGIYAYAANASFIRANTWTTFLGAMTAGTKYLATMNSVISTGGGVNYFPAPGAGSINTGGQYA